VFGLVVFAFLSLDAGAVARGQATQPTTTVAAARAESPPSPPPRAADERVTILFNPGSARLSNVGKARLDEVALQMKQDPALRAQVTGYTDASGSPDADQRISEQRAEAVKNYLVTRHGIDPSRIAAEGKGAADSTGDPVQDRRAVLTVTSP
jgi:OOP family OmpA-OmpF porin